jgi:hypothetical protein
MVALRPLSAHFHTRSKERAMRQSNITLLGVLIAVIIVLASDQTRAEPQTRANPSDIPHSYA